MTRGSKYLGEGKTETIILPDEFVAEKERKGPRREIGPRKRVLTIKEIEHLESLLREAFNYITELKKREALAAHIQYPKTPPILTESAVVHLRERLFPGSLSARFGGREGDIFLQFPNGERHVEVKATGEHGFEDFSEKDVRADWMVWIHFGTVLRKGSGDVVLFKFENPGKMFKEGRVNLEKVLKAVPEKQMTKITGSSLIEIIRVNS